MAGLDDGFERALLQELLSAYGPCGQEDQVREICRRELEHLVDELSTDAAGNLVALIKGRSRAPQPPGFWPISMNCPCSSSGSSRTARCG